MSLNITAYQPDQTLSLGSDLSLLDTLAEQSIVWIDIQTDKPEELNLIANKLGLHELAVEDCMTPGHFPKLEEFGSYYFLILRGLKSWDLPEGQKYEESSEESPSPYTHKLAIFLSQRFIVTHRRQEVPWLDAIVRQVQQMPDRTIAAGSDLLAHRVIDVLVDRFERGLEIFERRIDNYEEIAIETPDDFSLIEILDLKRELAAIRQMSKAQRGIIVKLTYDQSTMIDPVRRRYFRDIDDHAVSLINTLDKHIDALQSVRDAYLAFSNVRLGDTMRVLTVITTILAPMNVLVGLYGMNFEAMPLLHSPHGFWFVISINFTITVLLLLFFRSRRWI